MRDRMVLEVCIFSAAPLIWWASARRWFLFMSATHPNTASGAEFARETGVRPDGRVLCGALFMEKPVGSRDSVTECAPEARDGETYENVENNL